MYAPVIPIYVHVGNKYGAAVCHVIHAHTQTYYIHSIVPSKLRFVSRSTIRYPVCLSAQLVFVKTDEKVAQRSKGLR